MAKTTWSARWELYLVVYIANMDLLGMEWPILATVAMVTPGM